MASLSDLPQTDLPEATTSLTFARLLDPAEPMGGFIARDEHGAARGIVHGIGRGIG